MHFAFAPKIRHEHGHKTGSCPCSRSALRRPDVGATARGACRSRGLPGRRPQPLGNDERSRRRRAAGGPFEKFALAGLSMGGYVALEIMRQAADRVLKLALLDT